jgi:undecaprenyl-diphosphatase
VSDQSASTKAADAAKPRENPTVREKDLRRSERLGAALALAVAVAVLALCMLIVSSGKVSQLEKDVFHVINGLPDFLRPIMWVFQLAGLLFIPLLVAVVAAIFRKWWLALCLVLAVPVKLFFEHDVVKKMVDRQRPGTSICHGVETCGNFRGVPLKGESFVSGHAIITALVVTLLFLYLPRAGRVAVITIAILNGIARIYLGAHNPLDIVGGLAVGVIVGSLLLLVFEPAWRDARHAAKVHAAAPSSP